jgi:hypothetical protein
MGYPSAWKVLDNMTADFRRKGVAIPDKVINDLKAAKTILSMPENPLSARERFADIDVYIGNVESYLVSEGKKQFSEKCIEEWLGRLDSAWRRASAEEKEETRSISGLPRENEWIRIKSSNDLPLNKLEALVKESHLLSKRQDDGYLLIFGTDERVKDFVKMITGQRLKDRK